MSLFFIPLVIAEGIFILSDNTAEPPPTNRATLGVVGEDVAFDTISPATRKLFSRREIVVVC